MGSDISCPCSRVDLYEETPEEKEGQSRLINGRLSQRDIILDFYNDQTKICLIKTESVEAFFNNKSLFRIQSRRENSKYYNSVFICNYLAKNDLTLLILYDSSVYFHKLLQSQTGISSKTPTQTPTPKQIPSISSVSQLENGKFITERLVLVGSTPNQVMNQMLHNFHMNMKENNNFIGIINDSPAHQRQFYVLYKMNYLKVEGSIDYSIQIYKGELSEAVIESILQKNENKFKKLKAVMIDFTLYSNEEQIYIIESSMNVNSTYNSISNSNGNSNGNGNNGQFTSPVKSTSLSVSKMKEKEKPGEKEKEKDIYKQFKYYYFIFEENHNEYIRQEYLIVKMNKKNSPTEVYLQDISMKINDTVNNMCLSCVVSDEEKIFFIFNTTAIYDCIDEDIEEDDLEEINQYINSQQLLSNRNFNYEDD